MSAETQYKYLEPKPHKRFTKQLGIKGRNMTVWNLVCDVVVSGDSPEDIARRRDLPLEAVREALAYYQENKAWIDAEVEEEGRWLREHGYLKD
jgi:uncharacterized protein (DUF433 family)